MGHLGEQRALPLLQPLFWGHLGGSSGGGECPPALAREPSRQVAPTAQPLLGAFSSGRRESWHLSPGSLGDAQRELHGGVPVRCPLRGEPEVLPERMWDFLPDPRRYSQTLFLAIPAALQLGLLNQPPSGLAQNPESPPAGNRPEFGQCLRTLTHSHTHTLAREDRQTPQTGWQGRNLGRPWSLALIWRRAPRPCQLRA